MMRQAVILCFLCVDGEDLVVILTQLAQHAAITKSDLWKQSH